MIGPAGRVAFYYVPGEDDPLWHAGATWLGRDPATGATPEQPALPDLHSITADARRYGFHATLAPPMRLRPGVGWADVHRSAEAVAASVPPFMLPPLAVHDLSGFLALREAEPSPMLQAFCDACVVGADPLREPPADGELAHRRRNGLRPAEDANLIRWGYPYVFATWFFHMTLTRRLSLEERAAIWPEAERHFAEAVTRPREVRDIALFVEPEPGDDFVLVQRVPLRG